MQIYLITLFGCVLLSYLAERSSNTKTLNRLLVFSLIIFLIFISGFRYMNYYLSDEYNYRVAVDALEGLPLKESFGNNGEWAYDILNWICANIFHSNQAFIFIASILVNVLIVCYLAKYANPFWFAIFLYICSGAFFTSMNIVRQYVAVAIIIWCYPLARERRIILYFLLVALAAGFHSSAWIMLPLYFVLKREFDWSFWLVIAISVIVLFNFEKVMTIVLPNTVYDSYLENILKGGTGVRLIRIIVWLIPYSFIILNWKKMIGFLNIPDNIIYATGIAVAIAIMSYEYVYVARLDAYFSIVVISAIIKIPELFTRRSKLFMQVPMLVLFFIYGSYQMMISPAYHNILLENISGVL